MTKNYITRKEEIALYELLKEAIEECDPGYCSYKPGASEQKILTKLKERFPERSLTINHIGGYRRELFGILRERNSKANGGDRGETLEKELLELREELARLANWASKRPREPFKKEGEPQA